MKGIVEKISNLFEDEFKPIQNQCDKVQIQIKLAQLQQLFNLCRYKHKERIIHDANELLIRYGMMSPSIAQFGQMKFVEFSGNIQVDYKEKVFNIITHIRYLQNYPKDKPLIFIVNADPNRFSVNEKFAKYLQPDGFMVLMNEELQLVKEWNPRVQIVDVIVQLQKKLTKNFPFFQNPGYVPPQFNPANQNQYHNYNPNVQPQQMQQQQPQQYYLQQQPPISQFQQQQVQQAQYQNEQKKNEQKGFTHQIKSYFDPSDTSAGIGALISQIPYTAQYKQAEQQKDAKFLSDQVDTVRNKECSKIREEIKEQKQYLQNFTDIYSHQKKLITEQNVIEHSLKRDMQKINQEEENNKRFIEENENKYLNPEIAEEFIRLEPLSKQIIEAVADIQAIKETLHSLVQSFKQGNSDIDQIIKMTRSFSEQMFERQLLIKKCMGVHN